MNDFDRRRQSNPRAMFARRSTDLIHIDFGDRETVPAEFLDEPDLRIPVPEVTELWGADARRRVLEADSQLKGRAGR